MDKQVKERYDAYTRYNRERLKKLFKEVRKSNERYELGAVEGKSPWEEKT